MGKLILRKTAVILLIKTLIVVIISNILFFITFIVSNYIEEIDESKFLSAIEYDTLIFIIICLLECIILIFIILSWYKEKYKIEEGSIIHERGIIFKKQSIIHIDSVETIKYEEKFWGKIFNYGDITIIQDQNNIYKLLLLDQPKLISKTINKYLTKSDN